MCRYSGRRYRSHHVCFPCRAAFKRGERQWQFEDNPLPCPHCGGPTVDMGFDFHRPKRDNIDEWRKIELLWRETRMRYGGCGCPRFGPVITTYKEAVAYVAEHRDWRSKWSLRAFPSARVSGKRLGAMR